MLPGGAKDACHQLAGCSLIPGPGALGKACGERWCREVVARLLNCSSQVLGGKGGGAVQQRARGEVKAWRGTSWPDYRACSSSAHMLSCASTAAPGPTRYTLLHVHWMQSLRPAGCNAFSPHLERLLPCCHMLGAQCLGKQVARAAVVQQPGVAASLSRLICCQSLQQLLQLLRLLPNQHACGTRGAGQAQGQQQVRQCCPGWMLANKGC